MPSGWAAVRVSAANRAAPALALGAQLLDQRQRVSVGAGVLGLAFVVLMIIGDSGNAAAFGAIGHGGTERMIVYPAMIWMLALGGYLMGSSSPRDMGN